MLSNRPNKKEYFLQMLKLVASRSTCARRAVGAIITDKEGHVLSTGYNGVARNFDHCTDLPCPGILDQAGNTSNCMAIHAEQNALLQCLDLNRAHTIYCSCIPCFTCAKMICNTNIEVIICQEPYADANGFKTLLQAGLVVEVAGVVHHGA